MSSDYFDSSQNRIEDGTTGDAPDVNNLNDAIGAGFDKLPTEVRIKIGSVQYGVDSGAANAYVITLPYTPAALTDAGLVLWKPTTTSTSTAATANIGVGGDVTVTLQDGTVPYIGDLKEDHFVSMRYNPTTTNFEIESITPSIVAAVAAASSASAGSGILVSENDILLGYLNGKLIVGLAANRQYKTASYTITSADMIGLTFVENNDGGAETLTVGYSVPLFGTQNASGEVILTLPVGKDGHEVDFQVMAAQYLRVTATGSQVIYYDGVSSAVNGYVRSNSVGRTWTLKFDGLRWVITKLNGPILYDE